MNNLLEMRLDTIYEGPGGKLMRLCFNFDDSTHYISFYKGESIEEVHARVMTLAAGLVQP